MEIKRKRKTDKESTLKKKKKYASKLLVVELAPIIMALAHIVHLKTTSIQ